MAILKNWTARRSGSTITAEGEDASGNLTKITGIVSIRPAARSSLVATDTGGVDHKLFT